jgi:hypothetical protein
MIASRKMLGLADIRSPAEKVIASLWDGGGQGSM